MRALTSNTTLHPQILHFEKEWGYSCSFALCDKLFIYLFVTEKRDPKSSNSEVWLSKCRSGDRSMSVLAFRRKRQEDGGVGGQPGLHHGSLSYGGWWWLVLVYREELYWIADLWSLLTAYFLLLACMRELWETHMSGQWICVTLLLIYYICAPKHRMLQWQDKMRLPNRARDLRVWGIICRYLKICFTKLEMHVEWWHGKWPLTWFWALWRVLWASRLLPGLLHLYATGKSLQNALNIYDIDRGSNYLQ